MDVSNRRTLKPYMSKFNLGIVMLQSLIFLKDFDVFFMQKEKNSGMLYW